MGGTSILGIDPGTQVVGWGWLALGAGEARGGPVGNGHQVAERPLAHRAANVQACGPARMRVVAHECGVFRLGRNKPLPDRLALLARELEALLARLEPTTLALEEAFTGRSVQAALRVGEARGVVLSVAGRAGIAVEQFAPAKVKRTVTGHGAADKAAVAAMVGRQLGLPRSGPKGAGPQGLAPPGAGLPADATDALAAALCCLEQRRTLV